MDIALQLMRSKDARSACLRGGAQNGADCTRLSASALARFIAPMPAWVVFQLVGPLPVVSALRSRFALRFWRSPGGLYCGW
jgi:hypothetical protein